MSQKGRFNGRGARAVVGGSVAVVALAAAGVMGGVGFAKSSATSAQYQYGKVVICHYTHSLQNPFVTITIGWAAWPAHQSHGDTLGACGTTTTTGDTATTPSPSDAPGQSGDEHGSSGQHGKSGQHGNPHSH